MLGDSAFARFFRSGVVAGMMLVSTVLPAAEDFRATIESIGTLLEERYVDAELGSNVAASLRSAFGDRAFDAYQRPEELAAALTDFLRRYDRHFAVFFDSGNSPQLQGTSDADSREQMTRRQNHGFRKVEVRPGNVGYLDLRFFDAPADAAQTAAAAMRFLSSADAIIIDLRQNGGGEPGMVQLLCSYFFAEDPPVLLNSLYWRENDFTHQFWTLPAVEGRRMPTTPLFVLISARTGSAAEELAYNLQTRGRARLIGETTAGAANPGQVFAIGDGFEMFISTGKAINPLTGVNWEGKGVSPDREVPSLQADDTAYAEALEMLSDTARSQSSRNEIEWAREALHARLSPSALDPPHMRAYAGRYGSRQITFEAGELNYKRDRRPVRQMISLGNDRFLLQGIEDRRLTFERSKTGVVIRLVENYLDGSSQTHIRAPAD